MVEGAREGQRSPISFTNFQHLLQPKMWDHGTLPRLPLWCQRCLLVGRRSPPSIFDFKFPIHMVRPPGQASEPWVLPLPSVLSSLWPTVGGVQAIKARLGWARVVGMEGWRINSHSKALERMVEIVLWTGGGLVSCWMMEFRLSHICQMVRRKIKFQRAPELWRGQIRNWFWAKQLVC